MLLHGKCFQPFELIELIEPFEPFFQKRKILPTLKPINQRSDSTLSPFQKQIFLFLQTIHALNMFI